MNLIFNFLLCLSIALTSCAAGGGKSSGDTAAQPTQEPQSVEEVQPAEEPQIIYESADVLPLVPANPPTHEEIVQGMLDLIAGAQDSCARMLEEAKAKGSGAMQIAEAARAENEPRLTELAGLDYAAMTDEEIYDYMVEVSNIITAFREVRD